MEKYTIMAHGSSAQCLLNTTPHRELAYTLVATFNKQIRKFHASWDNGATAFAQTGNMCDNK